MYPVKLGFTVALNRIKRLQANRHHSEALLTAVFTAEKTLRRTLRQLVVSAGFPSRLSVKVIESHRGLESLKNAWELYDPKHRKLTDLIKPSDWQTLKEASAMRNALVHGSKVFGTVKCQTQTTAVIKSLSSIKSVLDNEYGYSGWSLIKVRRKSTLHSDPRVTWSK